MKELDKFTKRVIEDKLLNGVYNNNKREINEILEKYGNLLDKRVLDEFYNVCYKKGYKFYKLPDYIPDKFKICINTYDLVKYVNNKKLLFMFAGNYNIKYSIFQRSSKLLVNTVQVLIEVAKKTDKKIVLNDLIKVKKKILDLGGTFITEDYSDKEWEMIENLYDFRSMTIRSHDITSGYVYFKNTKIFFEYQSPLVIQSGEIAIVNTSCFVANRSVSSYLKTNSGYTWYEWNKLIEQNPNVIELKMLYAYKRHQEFNKKD